MRKKYTYVLEAFDDIKLAVSRLEQDIADIWESIKNDNPERVGFEATNARAIAQSLRTYATILYCELSKLEYIGVKHGEQ